MLFYNFFVFSNEKRNPVFLASAYLKVDLAATAVGRKSREVVNTIYLKCGNERYTNAD